jgi:hypothetical protein
MKNKLFFTVVSIFLIVSISSCHKKNSIDPAKTPGNSSSGTFSATTMGWYSQGTFNNENVTMYVSKDSLEPNYNGAASNYQRVKTSACIEPTSGLVVHIASAGKYFYRAEYGDLGAGFTVVTRGFINVAADGSMTLTEYVLDPAWRTFMENCNPYRFTVVKY